MTAAEIHNIAEKLLSAPTNYNSLSEINAIQRLERQLSSTHNSLSSLEGGHYEEVSPVFRGNGNLSVRGRFYLLVLFDFILINLMWLICVMLIGGNSLLEILRMQVLSYTFKTSLFDVALTAFFRFIVLLLFYGLLETNTIFFVAFTSIASYAFFVCKAFFYSWSTPSQNAFPIILLITSSIIPWIEAYFFKYSVLPQQRFASNYAQSSRRFSESLSTLLLDPNLRSTVMRHFLTQMASGVRSGGDSAGNFYSPLESPNESGDEDEDTISARNANKVYLRRGKDALEVAWSILNDCDWKLQKETPEGDCVYSKHEEHLGKVFLLRAKINIKAQKLLKELFLNVDKYPIWNKTVVESRRVQVIDEHTDITYQVSSSGGNLAISSRDFVILRHWDKKGDAYVLAGISIPYPSLPPVKKYIRGENGPCCWMMRPHGENYESCMFEFLLNTNLKGWIHKYVLEQALTSVLLEYSACLKEHCKSITRLEAP